MDAVTCVPACNAEHHGFELLTTIDGSDTKFSCNLAHGLFSRMGVASTYGQLPWRRLRKLLLLRDSLRVEAEGARYHTSIPNLTQVVNLWIKHPPLRRLGKRVGALCRQMMRERAGTPSYGHFATMAELTRLLDDGEGDEGGRCSVCTEQFSLARGPERKTAVALGRGHIFCQQCLEEWLRRENTCPLCRQEIPVLL